MSDIIRVLHCKVGHEPEPVRLDQSDLEAMHDLVGGWIEVVGIGHGYMMVVNEEGALIGLPPNACGIVGDFFFSKGRGDGDMETLDDDDVARCLAFYHAYRDERHPGVGRVVVMDIDIDHLANHVARGRRERDAKFDRAQEAP